MDWLNSLVVVSVIGLVAAPIGAGITWFVNRGPREAEAESAAVEASGVALASVMKSLTLVQEDNRRLHAQIEDLKQQVATLQSVIDKRSDDE